MLDMTIINIFIDNIYIMNSRKLNNIKIGAIQIKGQDNRKPKGHEMFPMTYANIGLIAKKKSGKTNLLYHILKGIVGPDTDLHFFVSTANRDATYKDMINYFKGRGHTVDVKLGIYDRVKKGKRKIKINQLEQLIDSLRTTEEDTKKQKGGKKKKDTITAKLKNDRPERPTSIFDRKITFSQLGEGHVGHLMFRGNLGSPKPPPLEKENLKDDTLKEKGKGKGRDYVSVGQRPAKRSSSLLTPERIFIFDDLSDQLNDPQVARLLKANRHFKAVTIVSTQYTTDIPPTARSQFDAVIAFKGHTPNKVDTIRKMTDTPVDEDKFLEMYKYATAEPYSFLYCNCRDGLFRKNFDEELLI